jgi:hypothetical protein
MHSSLPVRAWLPAVVILFALIVTVTVVWFGRALTAGRPPEESRSGTVQPPGRSDPDSDRLHGLLDDPDW